MEEKVTELFPVQRLYERARAKWSTMPQTSADQFVELIVMLRLKAAVWENIARRCFDILDMLEEHEVPGLEEQWKWIIKDLDYLEEIEPSFQETIGRLSAEERQFFVLNQARD